MDSSRTREIRIHGIQVRPGEAREIYLKVSESPLAGGIHVPITVIRGARPGPTAFVVGAIHGDEINGADIVRRLVFGIDAERLAGTLIAIPVANIPGFLAQSRYLPYHRDLNRYFPGNPRGHNADRFAHRLFKEVFQLCDFGIDLHTAADGRLNLPHVRGDMSNPRVRRLARAFGSTVMIDNPGAEGSLRRAATDSGIPTILFEAGETRRFSRKVSLTGLRGVLNVLAEMRMWSDGEVEAPPFQVIVKSSQWVRAHKGGILDLAIKPGDLIYAEELIGEVLNPFGRTVTRILSPVTGIVIGMTTAPLVVPGSAIVHVARLKRTLARVEASIERERQANRMKKRRTKR